MQYTLDRAIQIIRGEKTETRRPVHEGETLVNRYVAEAWRQAVVRADGSIRYWVGQTHAVQPGRGKLALLYHPTTLEILENSDPIEYRHNGFVQARHRILDIWQEDVLNISEQDAIAEGFKDRAGFWQAWIMMYDRVGRRLIVRDRPRPTIERMITQVPVTLRMAWALRFELV